MAMFAILWLLVARRLPNNEAVRVYPDAASVPRRPTGKELHEKEAARKNRRKLRKRLR
jgi:hypothetical protein